MSKQYRGLRFGIQLQEGEEAPKRIQLLKVGSFHDDRYGTVEIVAETLAEFKKNFDNNVRRIGLAVDYSHNSEDKAAGWIKGLELSEDGQELWGIIDWTPEASKALASKEFRYISAEFNFNYKDNESKKSFGPVLLGAGLTNRPVIKGMAPAVQLQEIDNDFNNNKKGSEMDQELKDARAKIDELKDTNLKLSTGKVKLQEFDMSPEEMKEEIKKLQAKIAELMASKQQLADDKELAEKTKTFETMVTEGKAVPAQKDSYLNGKMDDFIKLAEPVNLTGEGNEHLPKEPGKTPDAQAAVMKLAEAKIKDNKTLDMGDAISKVLTENPDLEKKYNEEVAV